LGKQISAVLEDHNLNATDPALTTAEIADAVLSRAQSETQTTAPTPSQQTRPSAGPTYLLTLNSRYRPFDRKILIEIADRLSTGHIPFVLVSTQAVEAGVDLSFETVFRDIAPLDSIVQAAGRCNRGYEWGTNGGRVVVWMLADMAEETPQDPDQKPPAYYVYEKGSTDAGIPGHLKLVSEVLADVPNRTDATDVEVSRDAVASYFEALEEKSLWSGELRDAIDNSESYWLSRQSLIGGVPTVDVIVGQTAADEEEIEAISDRLARGDPTGYDRLQRASGLRVSLPKSIVEDAPRIPRLDKMDRNSDGVNVFQYCGGSDLDYGFTDGGLSSSEESVLDRFTH